ncbi:hypothetical protein QJS04_geneDACA002229 [Acorus gramineus]|uniref:PB1 domain-containing protein n=1 Tax=Acorus gramineus TaxID=55184 RepID=A0AAV9AA61_ACOGR|nr:hypothetical protein QJS04_geneDACA002229 [Acorus gramineus]
MAGEEVFVNRTQNNISVQTGEEFSMEFLQDRPALRIVPGALRRAESDRIVKTNHTQNKDYAAQRQASRDSVEEHKPQSVKMKFLCSFGGRILPRPSDGKLRYVGGETRIITIKNGLSWTELVHKTTNICNQPHTIKYQLPGEDLDALISVSSDEDLQNMIEEYYGHEKIDGSQRLRLFLIPSNEPDIGSSSFDARAMQGNAEYQYVSAVNGMLEPSPQKSSSANSLVSQWGHNADGSPSFREPKTPHRPSAEELLYYGDNENSPFYVDHNKPGEVELPMRHRAVHFQNRRLVRDMGPTNFVRNDSDLGAYPYCEKPAMGRTFHSEKFHRQADDSLGWLEESNDSLASSQFGMPHAYSDPLLQDHHGQSGSRFVNGTLSPLDISVSPSPFVNLRERQSQFKENQEVIPLDTPYNLVGVTSMQTENDLSDFSGRNDLMQRNIYVLDEEAHTVVLNDDPDFRTWQHYTEPGLNCHGGNQMDEKAFLPSEDGYCPMTDKYGSVFPGEDFSNPGTHGINFLTQASQVPQNSDPTTLFSDSREHSDFIENHSKFYNETMLDVTTKHSEITNDEGHSLAEKLDGNLGSKAANVIPVSPPMNSSEDLLGGSPVNLASYLPRGLIPGVESSESLTRLNQIDDTGLSLNLCSSNPPPWSMFQNPVTDEALRTEVSLLDQDLVGYPNPLGHDVKQEQNSYDLMKEAVDNLVGPEVNNDFSRQVQLETQVTVEDVTHILPPGVHSSVKVVPLVLDEVDEDDDALDVLSPNIINAESISPESEPEDGKDDEKDVGESISDAAIAEIEAGVYGLQVNH